MWQRCREGDVVWKLCKAHTHTCTRTCTDASMRAHMHTRVCAQGENGRPELRLLRLSFDYKVLEWGHIKQQPDAVTVACTLQLKHADT